MRNCLSKVSSRFSTKRKWTDEQMSISRMWIYDHSLNGQTIPRRSRTFDDSWEISGTLQPQMKSVDEIVPLVDLFFSDLELTEADSSHIGKTVPTVLEAFRAKLEAMSDDEFAGKYLPTNQSSSKKLTVRKNSLCQLYRCFRWCGQNHRNHLLAWTRKIHPTHWKHVGKNQIPHTRPLMYRSGKWEQKSFKERI